MLRMKKILLMVLLTAFIGAACERNEPEPGERPSERLSEVMSAYKSQLVGAPYGWKAVLYPEGGGGYNFLFQFNEQDRVTMYSDLNASTAAASMESTYRLEGLQRPSLLFDTYSYLHILADPDASKSGGEWGEGQYSDFEFSFESASPDTITLSGNYNNSQLLLIRATQEEANNYISNIAEMAGAFERINNFATYFKRLTVDDHRFDLSVHVPSRQIAFSYYEGNLKKTFITSYYYTENGLVLRETFINKHLSIRSLNNLQYHAAGNQISLKVNNDISASIQEATSPMRVDQQAVQQFYHTPGQYWLSFYGFTVDGVQDALGVRSIPDFSLLVYWPKFDSSSGNDLDLMGFVFEGSIHYGPTAVPSFTNDGRIIYTFQEMTGADNMPAAHEPIVRATQEQWTDPEGYYVVQTGADTYDLVSAKDAKSWISFQ
jgi:hypothetical protein